MHSWPATLRYVWQGHCKTGTGTCEEYSCLAWAACLIIACLRRLQQFRRFSAAYETGGAEDGDDEDLFTLAALSSAVRVSKALSAQVIGNESSEDEKDMCMTLPIRGVGGMYWYMSTALHSCLS